MWRNLTDSKHYENGVFVNTVPTPVMLPGLSFSKVWKDYVNRPTSVVPPCALPTIKTDLKTIDSLSYNATVVVWFGHSSYLIAYKGLKILVDPVFSDHASPIPGFVKAFPGTTVFATDDLPVIDFLILSHNHTTPEETLAAARDLKAKVLLPVHWAKFALSNHPWDEPVKRLLQEAQKQDDSPNVTTPLIGEVIIVGSKYPASRWWERVL